MENIKIRLRRLELKDLENYYEMNHPSRLFHKYNGPYFEKKTEQELKTKIDKLREQLKEGKLINTRAMQIVDQSNDTLIGEVSWHWKSKETNWMEIGIIVFNEQYWGKGIGYDALKLWIDKLFEDRQELIRIGLTTWSGNLRMMALATKLGMLKEATYRKARIVDNEYYDSVSYGILREEWSHII